MAIDPKQGGGLTFTVDAGPKNAKLNKDGLRYYTWRGVEYPSVTTIRRMAGIPHGLHQWSMGKVIDRVMSDYEELERRAVADEKDARKWLRRAATEERDAAAERGSRIHWAAQAGLPSSEVEDDIRLKVLAYEDWLAAHQVRVLASECQVWNLSVGYAGTMDLLADTNIGRYVIDIKSGKGVYTEHALQVEAYARGEFIGQDDVIDNELSDYLDTSPGRAILHVTDNGWEFFVLNPRLYDRTFNAFKGLLQFATFDSEMEVPFLFTRVTR